MMYVVEMLLLQTDSIEMKSPHPKKTFTDWHLANGALFFRPQNKQPRSQLEMVNGLQI